MGCAFVMPSVNMYNNNSFTSCEADVGAAPGLYPQPDGSTSTFRQRYTGLWSNAEETGTFTVGNLVTPSGPATTPAVSQCTTYKSISNGINTDDWLVVSQSPPEVGTAEAPAVTTAASSSSASSRVTSGAASTPRPTTSASGDASDDDAAAPTASPGIQEQATEPDAAVQLSIGGNGLGYLLAGAAVVGGGLLVLA